MKRVLIAGSVMMCGVVAMTLSAGIRAEDAPAARPAPTNPVFEQLKQMVGTWVEADAAGNPTDKVVSIVKLTAGGSAVHETLFPGQPMEMISIYTQDKGDVVMTHYCAIGNQPRMKAQPGKKPNQIRWVFTGGSNLDPGKDMHMHGATVTILDADHIVVQGEGWVNGKPSETHCAEMKLARKK